MAGSGNKRALPSLKKAEQLGERVEVQDLIRKLAVEDGREQRGLVQT